MKTNDKLRIAIDGGASTGKSTVAKLLAEKLNIEYINTGAMYRYITLFAIEKGLLGKWNELIDEISKYNITYINGKINSDWEGFNFDLLNTEDVAAHVSAVAASKEVREYASTIQAELGKQPGTLLEGRDIGTVVLPDADYKFFLTVSDEEAARRRFNEYTSKGIETTYEDVLENVKSRNLIDSTREVAPLMKADDAIEIDTSNIDQNQVVEKILEYINEN